MYSKIAKYRVKNFMSIGEAEIDFTDSNIINFCGYNDSGKSALLKGLDILMYDSYSKLQKGFIKSGKTFFSLEVEFEDGVVIQKEKYKDGKGLWKMSKAGKVLYKNQEGDSIVAVVGVPEPIKQYWGVLEDDSTEQKLNVRKNIDKLFLVHTTGGENYKTLNVVLQSEVIAGASKLASEEKNATEKNITMHETMKSTYTMQLEELELLPEELIENIKTTKQTIEFNIQVLQQLQELLKLQAARDAIKVSDELPTINVNTLQEVMELIRLDRVVKVPIHPEIPTINLMTLNDMSELVQLKRVINTSIHPEINNIDVDKVLELKTICAEFNNVLQITKNIDVLSEEETSVKDEIKEISQRYNIQLCDNCGSVIKDKHHKHEDIGARE